MPLPLTAAAESRRSSRSAARKNGLDTVARISNADPSRTPHLVHDEHTPAMALAGRSPAFRRKWGGFVVPLAAALSVADVTWFCPTREQLPNVSGRDGRKA